MFFFLLSLLVFVSISGIVYVVLQIAVQGTSHRQERLAQISTDTSPSVSPTPVVARSAPVFTSQESARERQIRQELQRAGLRLRPRELYGFCLISGLLTCLIAVPTHSPILLLALAILGACLPWAVVKHRQAERIKQLEAQLADGALLLTSVLRAGGSFGNALSQVAGEMPAPLGEELRWAVAQTALGLPIEAALRRLDARIQSDEWNLFSAAIAIQLQVGGNLPETLASLAATLRERRRIQGEVQMLTAEGKLSGLVLFLLTPALTLLLCLRSPHYFQPLLQQSLGLPLIVGAAFAQILGGWLLMRLTALDL